MTSANIQMYHIILYSSKELDVNITAKKNMLKIALKEIRCAVKRNNGYTKNR